VPLGCGHPDREDRQQAYPFDGNQVAARITQMATVSDEKKRSQIFY
jgi:hypothetical protein